MYQVGVSFFDGFGQVVGGGSLSLSVDQIEQGKSTLVAQLVEQQRTFTTDDLGSYHALIEISRTDAQHSLGSDVLVFDREVRAYLRAIAAQYG